MTKTLVSVAVWALLGLLLHVWLGGSTGWAIFALGLLAMVLVSGAQLSRVSRWIRDIHAPPPHSIGPWDVILAPIYRQLKKDRQEIHRLTQHVDGILQAAEALPEGAVTLNEAMQVMWCNQTASDHIGLDLAKDRHHSILNILRSPEFARYARQAKWDHPLLLHTSGADHDRALLVQLTPYGVNQFLLVTRDVTQMEKLETMRKDFVANVSHELRTPITVLSGFLETLRDMPPDSLTEEQRQHYLALMLEQAARMQALVADLLTLSALESSATTDQHCADMPRVIREALGQAHALSNGQHVFVENIDTALCVRGTESELASAVSNLLTNAIRYTPRDGTITVSWYRLEDGSACYSVQDTGIGIAAQDIPRITERFYRVDRGRSRATGGTGLGLAITKHVAMRHHAELRIQSRFGAGSLFCLQFPAARVCRPEAEPQGSQPGVPPLWNRPTAP